MPSLSAYHLTGVSLTLDGEGAISLHGCSSKVQPLLLTIAVGYLLMATATDGGIYLGDRFSTLFYRRRGLRDEVIY